MVARRNLPQVEELGARLLPSATALPAAELAAAQAAPEPLVHLLSGQGEGTFTTGAPRPDVGTDYTLYGRGEFAGLGQAGIRGTIHSLGFTPHGHAGGTLVLTNDHGSVTLELTAPDQRGFSALPTTFGYKVIHATGAYANLSAAGSLTLMLAPVPGGTGNPHGGFVLGSSLLPLQAGSLDATAAGSITPLVHIPEDGAAYSLTGAGRLLNGDAVRVAGTLQSTGMIAQGRATGELTITGPHGTLTLDLIGPNQGAFAALPAQFGFTVHSGTGAYAHLSATGSVAVHLYSDGTFALAILIA